MTEMIEIIVDIHELDSCVFDAIAARGIGACRMTHLESGDVVIRYRGKTVSLEIKRGSDFQNSLQSGRLHLQLGKMLDHYDFCILVVEDYHPYKSPEDDAASLREKVRKHEKTLRTLNRRVTVQSTKHLSQTVDLIEEIVRDLKAGKLFVMRRPIQIQPEHSDQMKVICSFPNVKETIGERILDTYHTVEHALNNVDSWADDIPGLGAVTVARIKRVLSGGLDD